MRLRGTLLAILATLVMCGAAWAQNVTGAIAGTVKDPQGAVVPNAKVTLTDTDTKIEVRHQNTGSAGEFSFPTLPVGHYAITVEAPNFQKFEQTGIGLNVNDGLVFPITLSVGTSTQTVTVEATAEHVNLESAVASGVVAGTQVRELSLNNRNYEQLVTLVPGVSDSGNSDQFFSGATTPFGTNLVTFQINGGRREENSWLVDGMDNVDRGSMLTLLSFPSVDAISEFRVVRGVYDPELGRAAGGQINVITRSGTSSIHGGVYEFFRNDDLNANTFADKIANPIIPRPRLRYNDFGGTIGGPVWIPKIYEQKNKTFFFVSDEAHRIITDSNPTGTIPTAAMLNGQFAHPVCVARPTPGSNSCTTTSTTISNIDPVAKAYISDIFSKLPGPNAASVSPFALISTLRNVFNFREDLVKIDHTFSSKFSVSGKFLHDSVPTVEGGGLFTSLALPNVGTTQTNSPGHQYSVRATLTLSPTTLIDGGYGFSYGAIISTPTGLLNFNQSPDIKNAVNNLPFTNLLGRAPSLAFAGGGSSLTTFGPYNDYNRNQTTFGNFTKVIGPHTVKAGAVFFHYNKHENQLSGSNNGSFSFGTTAPAGTSTFEQAFADFLLGQVATFQQASADVTANIFDNQFEFYGQDTYRLRPNLTVSYGLRWSFFRQPTDGNGLLSNFDPAFWDPAKAPCITASGNIDVTLVNGLPTKSACNPNYSPLNGFIYTNPPTFDGVTGTKSPYGNKVGKEFDRAIAPRIGIAWDPFGNGRTSVRMGYGMFYDGGQEFGNAELNVGLNPGFLTNLNISNTTLANPTGVSTTSAATGSGPPTINGRVPIDYKSPYTQQWSLDIQREFAQNWMVDVGYYGNNGIHLPGILDLNQPAVDAYLNCFTGCPSGPNIVKTTPVNNTASTTLLNIVRPFLGYGPGTFFADVFTSNYNSFQGQVQRRFHGNSLINVSYTWSHGLTTDPADRSTGGSALAQNFSLIFPGNYGPNIADRRHVITGNFVWEVPWLRAQKGFAGHALGGWEVSGIQTFQTGLPLTAVDASPDFDAIGGGCIGATPVGCRPNQVGDPNSRPVVCPGNISTSCFHSINAWFNANAFAVPGATQITPGTENPGAIRGPGFWRTDLSLFRNIKLSERFTTQLRFETFNTFNHVNPICCGSLTNTSSLFNKITSARDPRILQIGAKLNF